MSICPCGYWWADCDENGEPISIEYCHYEGPAEWAPCEQNDNDYYRNEAIEEEEDAREEAEFEQWLVSIPEEQFPTNAREYVEAWKRFRNLYK